MCIQKDKAELAGAFDGMAPGDSRTVVIKIENQNSHKASFFISQKTTDALEEAGKASGGAYEFQVEIGNDTNRTSCWMQMQVVMQKMWQVPKV